MLDYAESSPADALNAPEAVVSGYFVGKEKQREGDIVISGYLAKTFWSSFLPFSSLRYKWEGTLSFSGQGQALTVVTWLTDFDTPQRSLNPVSIRGLPVSFTCDDFQVLGGMPSFSKIEAYKRMAEFSLNGEKLYVEFVPKKRNQIIDNHFEMLQDKKQMMQIIDEGGKIYADFDMKFYRIYELPPGASIEQLQMTLAVFSVVQHICWELRSALFVSYT
jgi:hypothetical protein